LFRSRIQVWQRLDKHNRVQTVPHDQLTIYERWLHGGAWMSIETGAIHLSHLLSGAGLALVAERDGTPAAYLEAYQGNEPPPFGNHIHLSTLAITEGASVETQAALIARALEQAKALKAQQVTVSRLGESDAELFNHFHLAPLARVRRFTLPARQGQIFYQSSEHVSSEASQINGWMMPIGRLTNARQQWEDLWWRTWDAIPEIRARKTHRLKINCAGQEALLCVQQQLYDPRSADIYCWSPKPLTNQLLSAIRDWTHRQGYRGLSMVVGDHTVKTLGAEAEPDGFTLEFSVVTAS
jgi:hypothetical protein